MHVQLPTVGLFGTVILSIYARLRKPEDGMVRADKLMRMLFRNDSKLQHEYCDYDYDSGRYSDACALAEGPEEDAENKSEGDTFHGRMAGYG